MIILEIIFIVYAILTLAAIVYKEFMPMIRKLLCKLGIHEYIDFRGVKFCVHCGAKK